MEMSALRVPIIVVVTGEGGSGGALGIGVGDEIMIFEYSYYSVSTPEACAAILWEDTNQADKAADALTITSSELKELGIIDRIISEPIGGAHKNPEKAAQLLKKEISRSLNELSKLPVKKLQMRRYNKYRKLGDMTVNKLKKPLNKAQTN